MTRFILGTALLCAVALPARAQLIGHPPAESPYRDALGKHSVTLHLGWLSTADDPAGVGPQSAPMIIGRYEYATVGPFAVTARLGVAPTSERNVKDPLFSGPLRDLGTRQEPLLLFDGGVVLNLTGDKTWRGIQPRVHTNFGLINSLNNDWDVGPYRFGPKFVMSYGTSLRVVRSQSFEWHFDLTHAFWRMNYPTSYRTGVGIQEPSLIGNRSSNPWTGNIILSVGVSRVWGR